MPAIDSRKGFALLLMLAVLAVGSILIAALFMMARLEVQSGENGLNATSAFEAAESGLGESLAWWDPALYDTMSIGATVAVAPRSLGRGGYSGSVTRLSIPLFLLTSDGWYQAAGNLPRARRALGALVRLEGDGPAVSAALTVVDTVSWDGASMVSGRDTIPPGWASACALLDSAVAGLATPPAVPVSLGLCPSGPCLVGNPPHAVDSALADSTLLNFGGQSYLALAARARYHLSGAITAVGPSVSGAPPVCTVTDSLNWGEPLRSGPYAACAAYFPVIHSNGDLALTGGRDQGILLVDGDLEIGGALSFHGLVIVLGTLSNGPNGGSITGAVLARSIRLNTTFPASSLQFHYSACVLPPSTRGSSLATPLLYRSWAQNF